MNADKFAKETYWLLKWTYGLVPIVAGLDKFTNLLVDWSSYLSPLAVRLLPIQPETFMVLVGVIEIAAGVLVLSRLTTIGAWVVTGWLLAIAVNLVIAGQLDVAVRDVVLAIGASRLARVSPVVQTATRTLPRQDARVGVPA